MTKPKPKVWRQCVRCGKAFKAQRSTRRYCSASCRMAVYRNRP